MNITPTLFATLCFLLLLSLPLPSLSAKYSKQDKKLLNQFFARPPPPDSEKCHEEERKILKKIEKAIALPPYFQSWTPDTSNCCQWYGITCDERTGRVIGLSIGFGAVVSGQIPDAVGDLPFLQGLFFDTFPNLTGPIPQSVTKLTKLTSLWITGTSVSGPIPSFLGKLKNLNYINLNSNKFSGPIPESLSQLQKLDYLRLDGNKLTSKVPKSFGNSQFYTLLDFSNNKLEGDISFLFGKKKVLQTGYFSRNMFEFDMSKIEFPTTLINLDLNHNKIYGSLPEGMTKLLLQTFNVSYNSLCGKIPTGGRLQKIEKTAYSHNRCLCGAPLAACK